MPRTTTRPRPVHVAYTYYDSGTRQREPAHGTWTRTREYCPTCGKQGTWANSDDYRLCTGCAMRYQLNFGPAPADNDVWLAILEQLRIAEAAAA